MTGQIPVWLLAVALAVSVPSAFAAGYAWCGVVRRRRQLRNVRSTRVPRETVDAHPFTE